MEKENIITKRISYSQKLEVVTLFEGRVASGGLLVV